MSATPLDFQIVSLRGGLAKVGGDVSPVAVTPTRVFLVKIDEAQVTPNVAGYALTLVAGWLYQAVVPDALVGIYYWYAEDENQNIIADGYIAIDADDTNTYRGCRDYVSAALLELEQADAMLVDDAGVRKLHRYRRGTTDDLLPEKTAKQPDATDLTNPSSQRLAGYAQE